MDYPLHYTEENTNNNITNNNNNASNTYRPYVFNNNPIMFNNTSTVDSLKVTEDGTRSSSMVMNRPSTTQLILQDPWSQHQLLHNEFNTNDIIHHQNLSHSERGIAGFVSKLYQCLQSTDTSQKYARWCHHDGKDMFIIDCIPEFTEVVLPRLFKHCKFPSFVRQLNIYGFQRDTDARKTKDTKDKESCRWYHPFFKPGRRDLFHLIRRKATRYSRKKRAKTEEDPETILNLGSADESETEENVVLIINQDDRRCSSSASSVNQTMAMDYNNNASSQLQLGFDQTIVTEAPVIDNEESDNADEVSTGLVVGMHPPQDVMIRENLKVKIFGMKRQYENMRNHFEEQLSNAQIQIEEQQAHIQHLESMLRLTKNPSVKLNTSNGYMNTVRANNNRSSYNYIQQSPVYNNLQKNSKNATSPNNQFYFRDKIKIESNTNEDLLHTPPPPPPPSTASPSQTASWSTFHQQQHHHDKNVSAGSNTNNENLSHHHHHHHHHHHVSENDKKPHMNFNSYNNNSF